MISSDFLCYSLITTDFSQMKIKQTLATKWMRWSNKTAKKVKCLRKCEIDSCEQSDRIVDLLRSTQLEQLKLHGISSMILKYPIDSICRLSTISRLHLDLIFPSDPCISSRLSNKNLIQLLSSLRCLRELFIGIGMFTLDCIRNILTSFNGIIKLDVGLHEQVNIEWTVLDDISAIIAARSELCVEIRVSSRHLKVSGKLPDLDFVRDFFQLLIAFVWIRNQKIHYARMPSGYLSMKIADSMKFAQDDRDVWSYQGVDAFPWIFMVILQTVTLPNNTWPWIKINFSLFFANFCINALEICILR